MEVRALLARGSLAGLACWWGMSVGLAASSLVLPASPRDAAVGDVDGDGSSSVVVPTSTGTAIVGRDGNVTELEATFRQVRSGPGARLSMSLSQLVDLDSDGAHGLLESRTGKRGPIKWTPRRADGGYGEPVVGETASLHRRPHPQREARSDDVSNHTVLVLWDTGDMDADGMWNLVEIDGRAVPVYPGRHGAGPLFSDQPATERSLQAPIRSWQGAMFVDLEGRGRLDLIAFDPALPPTPGRARPRCRRPPRGHGRLD